MALRAFLLAAVLLFCVAAVSTVADGEVKTTSQVVRGANRRLMQTIDCDAQCTIRCGANKRKNYCERACGTCCVRCKCVPPGTSGNKEVCGSCYMEMTSHNKTKCP
ncbi:hypothetical protein ACHQM5_006946 [Ranunculus cassubicifolius]